MQQLHNINYQNFSPNELCNYLEDRYYNQVIQNFQTTRKYLNDLIQQEHSQTIDLIIVLFNKLEIEAKQLFAKDRILLFPHIIAQHTAGICLKPINEIHQRIIVLLQKIRSLMNNYVQQPHWSALYKISCNELLGIEQMLNHVLYVKENFLWTRINIITKDEG